MAYREVERELELTDKISEALALADKSNAERDKANGKVRGWRLNINGRIRRLENERTVSADTDELLRMNLKAVNSWLEHGGVFDVDEPSGDVIRAVISQDDVFRTWWERTSGVRELAGRLSDRAAAELERQLNAVEEELHAKYAVLDRWRKEVAEETGTDARAVLGELRSEICHAYGAGVVRMKSDPSKSRLTLAVNARAVSGRASALHELAKTDIDAFYAEFPAGDRDYVVRHAQENVTSADVENLLKQLITRRMETEKTEYFGSDGGHLRYHSAVERRMSYRRIRPLLVMAEKPMDERTRAELEYYTTGAYEKTIAGADRINQIAREYGTLPLNVTRKMKRDTDSLKAMLTELIALAKGMSIGNSVHGARVAEAFVQAAEVMLRKADKGSKAFGRARDAFEESGANLKEWIYGSWYQFGGTPANHKKSFSGDKSTYVKPSPVVSWQGGTGKDRVD